MPRPLPLVLLLLLGCGNPPPAVLGPAPVLVVTVDGQPAAGLSLRLVGADGGGGGGMTDPAGRAAVRGPDDKAVPPGTYKVTVVDAGDDEANPMESPAKRAKGRVPAAYGRAASTPLGVTIEAGKGEYPVEVRSK